MALLATSITTEQGGQLQSPPDDSGRVGGWPGAAAAWHSPAPPPLFEVSAASESAAGKLQQLLCATPDMHWSRGSSSSGCDEEWAHSPPDTTRRSPFSRDDDARTPVTASGRRQQGRRRVAAVPRARGVGLRHCRHGSLFVTPQQWVSSVALGFVPGLAAGERRESWARRRRRRRRRQLRRHDQPCSDGRSFDVAGVPAAAGEARPAADHSLRADRGRSRSLCRLESRHKSPAPAQGRARSGAAAADAGNELPAGGAGGGLRRLLHDGSARERVRWDRRPLPWPYSGRLPPHDCCC